MIYQIKRNNVVIFEHEINGARTTSSPLVDFVDINFDYYEPILLERNDTIEFKGQVYYCDKQTFSVHKIANKQYSHRARFLSEHYKATDVAVLDPNGEHIFEIEGNLLTLITLAVNNLNRVYSGWTYVVPPVTETKLFSIQDENVMSLLAKISGEFEIPLFIDNKEIRFADIINPNVGTFAYGKGNGFTELTKTHRNEKVPNTIYASGGDGLQLDDPIVDDDDVLKNGIIEGFYRNENIRATTQTTVKTTSIDILRVDSNYNYDLTPYIINGQLPVINFETGGLAGLSFIVDRFEFTLGTARIFIKKRTVDGVEYPNNSVKATAGDRFNITNILQPNEAIVYAKGILELYATEFLNDGILKNLVLDANLDPLFVENLKINDRIKVEDVDLDIDGYFIVNDVKEYLQELNRKEIKLNYIGRNLFSLSLPTSHDDILNLEIQNTYNSLLQTDANVNVILEEELPAKEDLSNKVDNLETLNPNAYPNVSAVKEAIDNIVLKDSFENIVVTMATDDIIVTKKKTRVKMVLNNPTINVGNGNSDGDEISFFHNGATMEYNLIGNIEPTTALYKNSLFWWSETDTMWYQVI